MVPSTSPLSSPTDRSPANAATTRLGFLVYDARSGSTLLAALLNRLRGVSVSQESRFVAHVVEYPGRLAAIEDLPRLLAYLDEELQFRELSLDRERLHRRLGRLSTPWSRREVIDAFLDTYFCARDPAATLRVVKSGRMIYHLGQLLRWYPDAAVLHVVRDGRAVFASKRATLSTSGAPMETNVLKAALDWRRRMRIMAQHRPAVIEIRYEDIASDPESEIDRICDQLHLSGPARERTKSQSDYADVIGAGQRHLHRRVAKRPDPARTRAWMDTLLPWEVAVYERIAGRHLAALGYPSLAPSMPSTLVRLRIIWLSLALLGRRLHRLAAGLTDPRTLYRQVHRKLHESRV